MAVAGVKCGSLTGEPLIQDTLFFIFGGFGLVVSIRRYVSHEKLPRCLLTAERKKKSFKLEISLGLSSRFGDKLINSGDISQAMLIELIWHSLTSFSIIANL